MDGRTVALIGADGSGKTTVARRVCAELGPRARYVYMGSNPSAATHMLPTTRAWIRLKELTGRTVHRSGPPPAGPERRAPTTIAARALQHLKSLFVLALKVSEDTYRVLVVETLVRRGHVVFLDRHPYPDYYAHRVAGNRGWRRWGDRLHAFLLERVYPMPDEIILLDAPAEVLCGRKDEGTLSAIEQRRQEYLELARRMNGRMRIVDTRVGEDEVLAIVRRAALGASEHGGGNGSGA